MNNANTQEQKDNQGRNIEEMDTREGIAFTNFVNCHSKNMF